MLPVKWGQTEGRETGLRRGKHGESGPAAFANNSQGYAGFLCFYHWEIKEHFWEKSLAPFLWLILIFILIFLGVCLSSAGSRGRDSP